MHCENRIPSAAAHREVTLLVVQRAMRIQGYASGNTQGSIYALLQNHLSLLLMSTRNLDTTSRAGADYMPKSTFQPHFP